jgi:hypothetical protein
VTKPTTKIEKMLKTRIVNTTATIATAENNYTLRQWLELKST